MSALNSKRFKLRRCRPSSVNSRNFRTNMSPYRT